MRKILVIADDLTGALDSAGRLAGCGHPVPVFTGHDETKYPASMSVVDLNIRHEDKPVVQTRISQVICTARENGINYLYLKIDSTLRGPICEIILSARRCWHPTSILFCPAFPAQHRKVINNQVIVSGVPVNLTSFGHDPRNPVNYSSIDAYLHGIGEPLHHLPLDQIYQGKQYLVRTFKNCSGIWTADAEKESNLRVLSSAALESGITMMVGSAGLVKYLQPKARLKKDKNYPFPERMDGKTVFVIGSQHPQTREQVRVLKEYKPENILMVSALDIPFKPGLEGEIANRIAEQTVNIVRSEKISTLVIAGGDTARAAAEALGIKSILVGGEVMPGIPWARINDGFLEGIIWVSKAGGFGTSSTLVRIDNWLQSPGKE